MTDEAVVSAASIVAAGGIVALPTDTVYGVGVRATDPAAVGALFALKGRDTGVALAVLVADPADADDLVTGSAAELAAFQVLAESFWPGALTIVMSRRPGSIAALGGDESTIGLRCPASGIARALLRWTGPLAVSSANRSGQVPATTAAAVTDAFGDRVFVVDGGPCGGVPSTVVSIFGGSPKVLRPGPVTIDEIANVLARA